MVARDKTAGKASEKLMNIPQEYWEELIQEMEAFKTIYQKVKTLPPEKREKAQQDLLSSLIHLIGHLKVIYDDANF